MTWSRLTSLTHAIVTHLLRNLVAEEFLLAKCGMHPSRLDWTFYPSPVDIRYHVYAAKVRQQLSKLDQEEMTRRMEQWAQEHPSSNYYFRPFIPADDTESSSNKGLIDGNNTEKKVVFLSNCDDSVATLLDDVGAKQPLLW